MGKNLVILYSRGGQNYVNGSIEELPVGNTEVCAGYIRDAVGADVFELETVKPYPADYTACTEEARDELRRNARPELRRYLQGLDGYDNVFVCGPCWWGTFPMAIFSQLDRLDWTGKKVMPLMTHEGSGLGHCERDLAKACRGASFGEGLAVHGADVSRAGATVTDWARRQAQA